MFCRPATIRLARRLIRRPTWCAKNWSKSTSRADTKQELREAEAARPRSKHQAFMHELNSSGRSLADIQIAWHEYYASLPDGEKHQVWHEFYASASQSATSKYLAQQEQASAQPQPNASGVVVSNHQAAAPEPINPSPRSKTLGRLLMLKSSSYTP